MDQEIVLSESTFHFINETLDIINYKTPATKFIQRLQEDTLTLDNKRILDNKYEEELFNINNELLFDLWTGMIDNQVLTHQRLKVENDDIEQIKGELAQKTQDHIWIHNGDNEREKEIKLKFGRFTQAVGVQHYLNPRLKDVIIFDGRKLNFKIGDKFPLFKYLRVMLRNAKDVIIQDGYLVMDQNRKNLFRILKLIQEKVPVTINTLSDRSRNFHNNRNDNKKVDELIAEIEYRFPHLIINLVEKQKKELRQRWIKTDVWDIDIGHGLDSYKGGKIARDTTFAMNTIQPDH